MATASFRSVRMLFFAISSFILLLCLSQSPAHDIKLAWLQPGKLDIFRNAVLHAERRPDSVSLAALGPDSRRKRPEPSPPIRSGPSPPSRVTIPLAVFSRLPAEPIARLPL